MIGNVENPVQQISLADAYDLLVKSIKDQKFTINFDKKVSPWVEVLEQNSMK